MKVILVENNWTFRELLVFTAPPGVTGTCHKARWFVTVKNNKSLPRFEAAAANAAAKTTDFRMRSSTCGMGIPRRVSLPQGLSGRSEPTGLSRS
jgi:hypothetical protein